MKALGERHRRSRLAYFARGTVISRNKIRILTRYVEVALEIKCRVKGVVDARIEIRMALHKDADKLMLPIFVELALKLQDLAIFAIGVDHIKIFVRPEHESPQFAKFHSCV